MRLPLVAAIVVFGGMALWLLPFFLTGWSRKSPEKRDPQWRWGLWLEIAGFVVLWLSRPGTVAVVPPWRLALAVVFFALASLLSWSSARTLGRFLRFEAALDADHQLVRSGPYHVVRHPIYASMLCIFLGMAAVVATPVTFVVALALFVAGTEVRVHVEDTLLAGRFGEEFAEYRRTTPAYVPLVR